MAKKERAEKPKADAGVRIRKLSRKQAKLKAKKEARSYEPLPNSFRLTLQAFIILRRFWKTLLGIVAVYLVLNVIFASGVSDISGTVSIIKADLNSYAAEGSPLASGASGFLSLVSSAGTSSSSTGSVLQGILIVIESLVIIWALRQLLSGRSVGVKEAYYSSMTPMVPFLLVVFFILLQLLPLTFGSAVITAIAASLGTLHGVWSLLFGGLFILLAAWSAYMVSSSIFALYIVTLPGMEPRASLRSAKNLVRFRRWPILRRVLFLPVVVLVLMGMVTIPLILYATFLVVPVFYLLSVLAILFSHTYLYNLYRGLLE